MLAPSFRVLETPHFLKDTDLSAEELRSFLELALLVKIEPELYRDALRNRSVALLFEKPSLRTRMTLHCNLVVIPFFKIIAMVASGKGNQHQTSHGTWIAGLMRL